MQPRTKRQKEIFDYIARFIERQGYQPSYAQIAKYFRIKSKAAVFKHIAALEAQGLLMRQKENGAFRLEVMPERDMSEAVCEIPYYETLTAEILEDPASYGEMLYLPKFMLGNLMPESLFAFSVPNDSMLEEHIKEGDVALFERRFYARNGEIVLALVEKRGTVLKKYYDYGEEVELQPMNKEFEILKLPTGEVMIGGVFRALLRSAN